MSRIPEHHLDILQSTALAYIATIGPQDQPQVSPVWFGWDGTRLFFSMNVVRQKHHNLRREPRVAVAIADPANPYRSLEIRVVARIDADPTHRFANVLSRKYLQREGTADEMPQDEGRVVITVEPQHVVVFPFQKEES